MNFKQKSKGSLTGESSPILSKLAVTVESVQGASHQSARHLIPTNLRLQKDEGVKSLSALSQVNKIVKREAADSSKVLFIRNK